MNFKLNLNGDFQLFLGFYVHLFIAYIKFLNLQHLGAHFFLENVDTFSDPQNRQLHSPGEVSDVRPDFFLCVKDRLGFRV